MSVTYAFTYLREQVIGSQKAMDFQVIATGTYTSGGDSFGTPATVGLDQIDFVSIMYDGSGANTNGIALVAPNLTTNKFQLFGTGASSQTPFLELAASTTITGLTFVARFFGVA